MIDLTKIDDDTLMARGAYSTVNAKLRDEMKRLQALCGQMAGAATVILRHMQPEGDVIPTAPDVQLDICRGTLIELEVCTLEIIDLTKQKHDLRSQAWGKK